jgi:hypothetical protein
MEQKRKLKNRSHNWPDQVIFDKGVKAIQGGKDSLFNKWYLNEWISIWKNKQKKTLRPAPLYQLQPLSLDSMSLPPGQLTTAPSHAPPNCAFYADHSWVRSKLSGSMAICIIISGLSSVTSLFQCLLSFSSHKLFPEETVHIFLA